MDIRGISVLEEVRTSFKSGSRDIVHGGINECEKQQLLSEGYIILESDISWVFICKDINAANRLKSSRLYEYYMSKKNGNVIIPTWSATAELGLLLGYPPRAVEVFDSNHPDWKYPPMLINYCGIIFKTFRSTIIYDIEWLYKYKPVDEEDFSLTLWKKDGWFVVDGIPIYSITVEKGITQHNVLQFIRNSLSKGEETK